MMTRVPLGSAMAGASPLPKSYRSHFAFASQFQGAEMIAKEFGSIQNWEKDFKGTGAMRGIGWTVLYFDKIGRRILSVWINEHDTGHLSGCAPLLIMDVFEHAYMVDYQLKRPDYIEAFAKAVNWKSVAERFQIASA